MTTVYLVSFIRSDCRSYNKRTAIYTQLTAPFISAKKLFEVDLTKELPCSIQCIGISSCYYLTHDVTRNVCTIYSLGTDSYSTNNLQTYVLTLGKTEVYNFVNNKYNNDNNDNNDNNNG